MCVPQPLGRYGPYDILPSFFLIVSLSCMHISSCYVVGCMGLLPLLAGFNDVTHSSLVLVGLWLYFGTYICHIHTNNVFNNAHDVMSVPQSF